MRFLKVFAAMMILQTMAIGAWAQSDADAPEDIEEARREELQDADEDAQLIERRKSCIKSAATIAAIQNCEERIDRIQARRRRVEQRRAERRRRVAARRHRTDAARRERQERIEARRERRAAAQGKNQE